MPVTSTFQRSVVGPVFVTQLSRNIILEDDVHSVIVELVIRWQAMAGHNCYPRRITLMRKSPSGIGLPLRRPPDHFTRPVSNLGKFMICRKCVDERITCWVVVLALHRIDCRIRPEESPNSVQHCPIIYAASRKRLTMPKCSCHACLRVYLSTIW